MGEFLLGQPALKIAVASSVSIDLISAISLTVRATDEQRCDRWLVNARQDLSGDPNTITLDVGPSKLAQGTAGQHTLVDVERWHGSLPEITVLSPPPIEARD